MIAITFPQALGLAFAFGAGAFSGAWLLGFFLAVVFDRTPATTPTANR